MESRKCTTFSIGGVFENLYEPQSVTEVASLVGAFWMYGVSWLPLGAGSNLLVADRTFHEPVIRLGQGLRGYSFLEDGSIEVAAGASLMTLSRESAARGLTGLEFAGGIPASLGGAVRMNAGAHGGELFDVLRSIEVVTAHGETKLLAREEIPHSYRHTELPSGALVTRVWLKLRPDDPGAVQERRAHFLKERKTRQPLSLPSAGSVFKNPSSELSAGRAIEDAGLKGREEGGGASLDASCELDCESTAESVLCRRGELDATV